jgi:TrmH family RNA methyltransferase
VGAFLVEGPIAVHDALSSDAVVLEVFATQDDDLIEAARSQGASVHVVEDRVLASLSDTTTPRGVVATVRDPSVDLGALLDDADLTVVLADVRDPGNAGTLMRSALAAGASGVVFTTGSVDVLHPKTVRAAAGGLFGLRLVRGVALESALSALRTAGLVILGATAAARRPVYSVDLTRRFALVLGNEAWGLPPEGRSLVDEEVGIPMPGPAESLNVAVAGSIMLFEAVRQRRLSSRNG